MRLCLARRRQPRRGEQGTRWSTARRYSSTTSSVRCSLSRSIRPTVDPPPGPWMQVARQQSERLVSCASRVFVRWASKKQGGSTSNGRDSQPKFLAAGRCVHARSAQSAPSNKDCLGFRSTSAPTHRRAVPRSPARGSHATRAGRSRQLACCGDGSAFAGTNPKGSVPFPVLTPRARSSSSRATSSCASEAPSSTRARVLAWCAFEVT